MQYSFHFTANSAKVSILLCRYNGYLDGEVYSENYKLQLCILRPLIHMQLFALKYFSTQAIIFRGALHSERDSTALSIKLT